MIARSSTSKRNRLRAQSSGIRSFVSCVLCIVLVSISTAAYPQKDSVLRVVPKETFAYLRIANPREFAEEIADLVNSLDIPDLPPVNIDQLIDKMTDSEIRGLMDMEDMGLDIKGDICLFWTALSTKGSCLAFHVSSREKAEKLEAKVREKIGGTDKEYKGVTYVLSSKQSSRLLSAWVFLEDVLILSGDETSITSVIETYLKEKPSILQDEKYLANIENFRAGDVSGYAALDGIISTYLPLLQMGAEKVKGELPKQMKQQEGASPDIGFDPTKMLEAEINVGLWLLEQIRSYGVSMGIRKDGIWLSDSLKFKPDSPICDYLNVSKRRLKLVEYLPEDALIAGGATIDVPGLQKLYSVMFDVFAPILQDKMTEQEIAGVRRKYDAGIHEFLSLFGDEVAFAILTKTDKIIPRVVYILDVVDESKAQKVMGDFDYMMEISKPFYEAFGMDFQMKEGPTQKYSGVQVKSLQIMMDMGKMMSSVPNAAMMYPERMLLWYAFVNGKMILSVSQSADSIKGAIDTVNGRKSSIANSASFEDIDIRLPEKRNAVVYVSPKGYLGLVMGMMSQMGQGMPVGVMPGNMKPDIGFGVTTSLDGDGIRNFSYILVKEIQELVGIGVSLGQMMSTQMETQMDTQEQ